ncbi:EamA family transporter [Anderseniella sp. Alg231-50]|uniref:EamA family transporter n=1 Tax=Anderseniella sp. Alg231-50 TaxID=1922226 RepID=UPI000D54B5DF
MTDKNPHWTDGVLPGCLGMLGFSGTLVATRVAVSDFSPLTITCARIVMAGILGLAFLAFSRKLRLPEKRLLPSIVVMGLGLAVGFPFFLALALEDVPAVHGAVVTGLSPAATAIIFVARGGERPPVIFWLACMIGFAGVFYFAYDAGGGHLSLADGWLFLALLCVAIAYVEGGRVSGELGGTTTLSWAMVLLAPAALIAAAWSVAGMNFETVAVNSWTALIYLGVVSMFLASVFWYRGLAAGGVARIGQINLLLPLVALGWSALFLGEEITPTAIVCTLIVFSAMIVCLKSRTSRRPA